MSITVFRHSSSGSLGNLDIALKTRRLPYRMVDAYKDDLSSIDPLSDDLMIFLGGNCGVYQEDIYPFITEEVKIIEKRIKAGKHVLGICFGSQLIAKALGAKVFKGFQGIEYGWSPLKLTDEGQNSLVKHLGEDVTNMLHFHGDTFDLPKGTVLLASSEKYDNQAFSYEDHVMALQCHPEINHDILKSWEVNMGGLVHSGKLDIHTLRKNTDRYLDTLIRQADTFMNEWLYHVYGQIMEQQQA